MSRQHQQLSNRRSRGSRVLTVGLVVLVLVVGVWVILDWFVVQDSDNTGSGVFVDQDAIIDQFATAREPDNGQNNSENLRENTDAEFEMVATLTPSQVDLGLDQIVREFILMLYGGETPDARSDYVPSTNVKLESADPETRRRGEFERAVRIHLWSRQADDPSYQLLRESTTDGWWSCVKEHGGPSLEEFGSLSREEQKALEEELGLVGERMEQLQTECWNRARIYAGKDEETDRLLQLQYQYYLQVAQDWVQQNPDSVVPLR